VDTLPPKPPQSEYQEIAGRPLSASLALSRSRRERPAKPKKERRRNDRIANVYHMEYGDGTLGEAPGMSWGAKATKTRAAPGEPVYPPRKPARAAR